MSVYYLPKLPQHNFKFSPNVQQLRYSCECNTYASNWPVQGIAEIQVSVAYVSEIQFYILKCPKYGTSTLHVQRSRGFLQNSVRES